MIQYVVQRLLLAIPTMLGITLVSFLIMHLAPGDPVDLFLGGAAGGEGLSTDQRDQLEKTRQQLRHQLGLDRPLHEQYGSWLSRLVLSVEPLGDAERQMVEEGGDANYRGSGLEVVRLGGWRITTLDFGLSFKDQQPVIRRIVERLPVTIEIGLISLMAAYLIGVPLGMLLAIRQNTLVDRIGTAISFMLWSMPSFWVGMLLIIFLCNREFLHWFPASGIVSIDADDSWGWWRLFTDHLHHMALPIVASTYASFAAISRYMRTSMLENIRLDYVRTARAKGLAEHLVIIRHVLRNSLIPIITLMAGLFPALMAGSVFVETIFTLPGLGLLSFQSVISRDYPMVMAILTISSALSLLGILAADVMLKVADPRIDFGSKER
ncbi:MAG: ABC transporter permease [Gemmatimonadetes bacterium]|jgi:peptide/nickel transport system permease protein|nr:ABC transporter permease [Gemmatimonadota bacterium]MBT7861759.1 ABC transporter permease [Gemmatimonadota bacterium]